MVIKRVYRTNNVNARTRYFDTNNIHNIKNLENHIIILYEDTCNTKASASTESYDFNAWRQY